MKLIVLFLIAFAGVFQALANGITAKVVSVIDGNTIEIESPENGIQRVVLFGIDCPELDQEFGAEARMFLEKMVLRRKVTVHFQGKDRIGNHLGVVMNGDEDVRIDLLKGGFAWMEEKSNATDLMGYAQWARQKGRGLWKNPSPTPPWVYRRQQSMTKPKSS